MVEAVFKQSPKKNFLLKKMRIKKLRFFLENTAMPHSYPYHTLTSCKKSKKSLESFLRTSGDLFVILKFGPV